MDFSLSDGERNFDGCVFQGKEMCTQVKLQKGQNRCLQVRLHNSKLILTLTTRYHIYGQTLNKVQLDKYLQNNPGTVNGDDEVFDVDDYYPNVEITSLTEPPSGSTGSTDDYYYSSNDDDYGYGRNPTPP